MAAELNPDVRISTILKRNITLEPKHLSGRSTAENLLAVLKREVGDRCISIGDGSGYVYRDSIRINKRGAGSNSNTYSTGSVKYEVEYVADICSPAIGDVVEAQVIGVNKMGLLAEAAPIRVIVSRQMKDSERDIDDIQLEDMVRVEVLMVEYTDKSVRVFGKLLAAA